ncbi:MAG: ATP synthase F1 subunit gamma/F-type H+-transporting ATPase subunit gamma [Treponematales bacterium]
MANLRDLRLRIRAIRQTLQVTKAMNLISTAKLRKARRVLEDTEPFFTRIRKSMFDIFSGAGAVKSDFFHRPDKNNVFHTAVIVITSDKGLAGGYNANVCREAAKLCGEAVNPVLLLIGNIGARYLSGSSHCILETFSLKSRLPEMEDAEEITDYLISQYLWGAFDKVHIVYTHMYSSLKLLPTERQILPLDMEKMRTEFAQTGDKREELRFEYLPSKREVFDALVPFYIRGIIYSALVESYASEQNARMTAMDESSKNAEDMLGSLQLHYNRVRQAGITQEITEISGGAVALEG